VSDSEGNAGWRVLEASTKPVLEQRSFTKLKLSPNIHVNDQGRASIYFRVDVW
jgi:hypothetical protein